MHLQAGAQRREDHTTCPGLALQLAAQGDFAGDKVAAGHQAAINVIRGSGQNDRLHLDTRRWFVLRDIQRAFDMQFARATSRVQAPIIVHAVGDIGVFLELVEQNAAANSVYGTRRHKDHVTGRNRLLVQQRFQPDLLNGASNLVSRAGRLKAVDNARSRRSIKDIPEFSLAQFAAFVLERVLVVGVYLYRKSGAGVDEFGQQRETPAKDCDGIASQQVNIEFCDQLTQRPAGIWIVLCKRADL